MNAYLWNVLIALLAIVIVVINFGMNATAIMAAIIVALAVIPLFTGNRDRTLT